MALPNSSNQWNLYRIRKVNMNLSTEEKKERLIIALSDVNDVGKLFAEMGMTPSQWRILNVLNRQPAKTVKELAIITDLSPSGITRVCDKLVDKRMITRTVGFKDRRRMWIEITPLGSKTAERLDDKLSEWQV